MRELEVRFLNGWPDKEWHEVTGRRNLIKLPCLYDLPPLLKLNNGVEIHPQNPNVEIRRIERR